MAPDNPWFLITQNEIAAIQERLHTLEGELPIISRHHVREITGIFHEVRDRRP